MEFTLRKAQLSDTHKIAELSNELGYVSDFSDIENRLKAILMSTTDVVFVADSLGEVVGWIHGFYTQRVESDAFVEIGGLVVSENVRKQSVGRFLVLEIANWAEELGCKKVRVRSNVIRNEAELFYTGVGFDKCKTQNVFDFTL
jgi:N-acetylglutamate synthase-like GNAT family acetyltransferase